ncbi:leucine-rich repeat, cysteine-containing subtype protein [Tanacetum coccineum]
MAPTKRKTTCKATTTKHKPKTTKAGEEILDLVVPYIHNFDHRNSVSLVSPKFCEIDGITRKRLTVHALYSNPSRLSKRFPFIEALTLKGPPSSFHVREDDYDIRITPWIEQLYLEFRCLKELSICGLVVNDEDLETLARTRGNDLRSLKIRKCRGFTTDGLKHVSKYCNQLRTLCLGYARYIDLKDGIWLQIIGIEEHDWMIITGVYCLRGVPIWKFYLPKMFVETGDWKLLVSFARNCANLPIMDVPTWIDWFCFCKRRTKLECLKVWLEDISNEALECVGTHLKNLRDFHISDLFTGKEDNMTDLPLDNGYGANLRSLSLTCIKESDAGHELSKWAQKLRKLKLRKEQVEKEVIVIEVVNCKILTRYAFYVMHLFVDGYPDELAEIFELM